MSLMRLLAMAPLAAPLQQVLREDVVLVRTVACQLLLVMLQLEEQHMGLKWVIAEALASMAGAATLGRLRLPLASTQALLPHLLSRLQWDEALDGLVAASTAGSVFADVLPAWRMR